VGTENSLLGGVLALGLGIWSIWSSYTFYFYRLGEAHISLIEGSRPGYRAALHGIGLLGIGAIGLGISMALPITTDTIRFILTYITGPFCLLGLGLAIWQPRWLTPAWLKWIEDYNYDIRSLLAKEARQEADWAKRIRSQADLEAWVAEVRQKHHRLAPSESYVEALRRAGMAPPSARPLWGIGIFVIAVASGLGQFFLGNALIGFVVGGGIFGLIYLLRPKN
jgi:hypothetical protein